MLGLTKTRLIEERENKLKAPQKNEWRELFKDLLQTHSERGLYLKGLRLREEYTQVQLAKMLGTTANNISSMERGKRPIGRNMAQKLAAIFKVKYQRFL